MIDAVRSVVQLLLASLGVIVGTEMGSATVYAVALAAALIVLLLHTLVLRRSAPASLARPCGAIDVSVAVAQSDPDAAGHSRSRAPGFAASAA